METEIERLNKIRERIIEKGEKVKNDQPLKQEPKQDLGDDGYRPMVFTIKPNEVKLLNEWMGHIYAVYGSYGNFHYNFESTGGLGYEIWVYSDLAKAELKLTKDVDY